jgi:hypothetical protein
MTTQEALLNVFLSGARREVFHSVEHRHQIWREDPFDVECVHETARSQFRRLLAHATTPPGLEAGRLLLLLGDAGSGKTHLVRAFRNHVHVNGLGFVAYMQMTTGITSYGRYLVSNVIDSLDQPYYESLGTSTGLLRLSGAVAARCGDGDTIRALAEDGSLPPDAVIDLVDRAADRLLAQPRFADLDLDLVRALLFLQRQDTALKKRVIKYLRCEELAPRDRKMLGELPSRRGEEDAQHLVEELGRLMWSCDNRSLVLCVDQFEDTFQNPDAEGLFRRTLQSLCAVADQVPSSIVVIACLQDYYDQLRPRLTRSTLDRLEKDPPPLRLDNKRSAGEIQAIIQQRLDYLYEVSQVKPEPGTVPALFPLPPALLAWLSGQRIRDALDECQHFREACVEAGQLVDPDDAARHRGEPPDDGEQRSKAAREKIEQAWNDFLAGHQVMPSDSGAKLAELIAWAVESCANENGSKLRFDAAARGETIAVRVMAPDASGRLQLAEEVAVSLCNKGFQRGALNHQLDEAVKQAGHRIPVVARCGEFARSPKAEAAKKVAEILRNGGRKAIFEESDLRRMAALRQFRQDHGEREHFAAWLAEEKHLSRLLPLIHMLDLDHLDRFERPAPPRPAPAASEERPSRLDGPPPLPAEPEVPLAMKVASAAPRGAALELGASGELAPQCVSIGAEVLTSHSAYLGSTGSGKTTLALNVVEQLLVRGVPAILVDRKGDLCNYARRAAWAGPLADTALEARRRELSARVDVAVFTPGHPEGRQLALPLIPRGLAGLKDLDREQAAGFAAQALADMLGYKHTGKDKALRTILVQAFRLFAAHGNADQLDMEALISFIHDEDPALVDALGHLDTKLFKDLVQDLEVLKLSSTDLLSSGAEELDAELLFGLGPHARPGRTRLCVVSTKFLGDSSRVLFWVSQLLLALSRWVTRAPSPDLQGVVLFDEADLYLPALTRPATKAPMEDLLRRARSGGLGLMLATQSPGDLDYKCRDNIRSWFVGRVTQTVALEKMKPLFSEARVNPNARIPAQETGEFHLLQDGKVLAFRAGLSAVRPEQLPEAEILALAAERRAEGE